MGSPRSCLRFVEIAVAFGKIGRVHKARMGPDQSVKPIDIRDGVICGHEGRILGAVSSWNLSRP